MANFVWWNKVAKSPNGNSARIYVPKSWAGKKVVVLLMEELGKSEVLSNKLKSEDESL